MKALLAFVIITVAGLTIALFTYVGLFKSVSLGVSEEGPLQLVANNHVGPYHKIVPKIEEVERWAVANGEACKISFGEYLDDPNRVDEDRLKSRGGCLVEKEWSQGLPAGLVYQVVPRRLYVTASFEGAPSIGPFKVYPKALELIEKEGLVQDGPVIETYERLPEQKLRTRYYFPVKRP